MSSDILYLALGALAFGLALNLKLTFALRDSVRRERVVPEALEPGATLAPVAARGLGDAARVLLPPPGQACALLFVDSRCPKCRSTLPQLATLLPAAGQAGLAVWIVSVESGWRLRAFLADSPLAAVALRVGRRDYRTLNPTLSSPSYLFVSHTGIVQACGPIGDADWLGLLDQLAGDDPAASRAA